MKTDWKVGDKFKPILPEKGHNWRFDEIDRNVARVVVAIGDDRVYFENPFNVEDIPWCCPFEYARPLTKLEKVLI